MTREFVWPLKRSILIGVVIGCLLAPAIPMSNVLWREGLGTDTSTGFLQSLPLLISGYAATIALASPLSGLVGLVGGVLLSIRAKYQASMRILLVESIILGAGLALGTVTVIGGLPPLFGVISAASVGAIAGVITLFLSRRHPIESAP